MRFSRCWSQAVSAEVKLRMSKELFLLKELLSSMRLRAWVFSLVAVMVAAIFLGVLALLSLLVQPNASAAGVRLIAIPLEDLSQVELSELHQKLMDDAAIVQARYDVASLTAKNGEFEITLSSTADPVSLSERLRGWGKFQHVGPPSADSLESWRAWLLHSEKRWIALVGLILLLGLALAALYSGLSAARRSFAGELELLELSGVSSQTLRTPFALLGFLYGLVGALLVGFELDGLRAVLAFARTSIPEIWESTVLDQLGARGFLLGIAFAGVCGFLGWRTIQKYPNPFRRSRTSSSSAAEVAKS